MDGFKRRTQVPRRPSVSVGVQVARSLPRLSLSTVAAKKAGSQQDPPPFRLSPLSEPASPQSDIPGAGRPLAVRRRPRRRMVVLGLLLCIVAVGVCVSMWYFAQLTPVNADDPSTQKVVIEKDTSFSYVVKRLKARGLIRSELATSVYGILSGKRSQLKEGSCVVTPSLSTQQILDKLTSGCHDFKSITFYPGATIEQPLYKPVHATLDATMHVKYRLQAFGFSAAQIDAALAKSYTGPLFADKPAGTSLEGYIFGETYYVDVDATPETILQTTFDEIYQQLVDRDLVTKFRAHGLNLYQAITLASIVQRELNCEGKPEENGRKERCYQYQRTIAQVFLKRLQEGISLGSDVTFIYAADMKGVTPTVDIDSPYNTRIHTGLPPGPIASPGLLALRAVADPASTDYLFFIAGDDGLIYFAKDQAGHEANIRDHCQILCNEL
jgi:UPF0755 protein